jgi:phosphate/phosphite/phosphonate ABC transporter binding protein
MAASVPQTTPPRVGRYEILERLAIGGMAEVYLARERAAHGLTRLVVIKRILPHLAQHESMVQMFLQEARIAARINHPNVVQILELGEDGGFPFIAMEYVAGSTLRDLIVETQRQGRLIPVAVALHLMQQACAGTHAAHELKDISGKPANLVHRDLTPHNLMVDGDGHLKLLDFGIAKEQESEHTRTGVLKGKIRYMSPEQCNQEVLDRRSDIFTLAIVLWEMLAGERLFERQTELMTMQAIAAGQIRDLRPLRPEVPEPIVQALEMALAAKPADRPPTADAFRKALNKGATDSGLIVTSEAAAAFVTEVLGARHTKKRVQVEEAMERSASIPVSMLSAGEGEKPTVPTNPSVSISVSPIGMVGIAGIGAMALAGMLVVASLAIAGAVWLKQGAMAETAPIAAPEPVPDGPPVRIALAPAVDPAARIADFEPLRIYLQRKLDRPVSLRVGENYSKTGLMLDHGDVEFAILPPYITMITLDNDPQTAIIANQTLDGSSGTDGVLLVKESSTISSATELRGHTICYTDKDSTTGYLLPRSWLRKQSINPDKDLVPHMSDNHFQSMRDLEAGVCDVAGTYSGAWLAADRAGVKSASMRVLAVTGRTPHDAFMAGPAADADLRAKVSDALLGLDVKRDLGIEHIGETEKITGFLPPDPTRYDELRKALQAEMAPAPDGKDGKSGKGGKGK